jgi:REP element-mobilizing transposase RayT
LEVSSENPGDELPHSHFLERDSPVRKDRRHLPHWRLTGVFNYITWRLYDSLPQEKLMAWRTEKHAWLIEHPKPWDARTTAEYRELFPKRLDAWLDAGYGSCYLRRPECGAVVANAFHYYDGDRYNLASYVVMPNHVHALFCLRGETELESVTHSIKSYTSNQIKKLIGRRGQFWQHEGFDHLLRGAEQLNGCMAYIRRNPEDAGLKPGEYVFYEAPGFRDPDNWT